MQLPPQTSPVLEMGERMKGMELEMAILQRAHTEHLEKTKAESERIDGLEKQLATFKVDAHISVVYNHLLITGMARFPSFSNRTTMRPERKLRLPRNWNFTRRMPR
jgi:hypothetical protein